MSEGQEGVKGKKFNMAEGGYRDADVYDYQVRAHKIFFEDKLPCDFKPLPREDWPSSMPTDCRGKVYDITSFNGQQVVAVLSLILNDKTQFKKGETFYLLIRNSSEDNEEAADGSLYIYRLSALPTVDQPGNGIVVLRPKGHVEFPERGGKRYSALGADLKRHYTTKTTSFAEDIKKLFKGNTQNEDIPQATMEAYMILLFEIARRLVKNSLFVNPSQRKKEFDRLPIGSAVARLISLLELGISSFDDMFSWKGRFHCFKGEPHERRKAIETINEAIETIDVGTVEQPLKELQELFCSDQHRKEISSEEEDRLAKTFKDMRL